MYLIIAYHGKGKKEVEEDLKKLWFNFSNFVKLVKVNHMYFFQNAKDNSGANLLMIVDYKCAKSCPDASVKCYCAVAPGQNFTSKDKNVNYWLYIRDKSQKSSGKEKKSMTLDS